MNNEIIYNNILVEYIWLDGFKQLRSKIKVLEFQNYNIQTIPITTYTENYIKKDLTKSLENVLKPVQMYKNPFHKNGLIVLCENYIQQDNGELQVHHNNTRYKTIDSFQYYDYFKPIISFKQQYYIVDNKNKPYGIKDINKQNTYYCGTSNDVLITRKLAEEHLKYCLYAELKITSLNSGSGPSQWEYNIGPLEGIEVADQIWVSRYILTRLAETYSMKISFNPTLLGNEWEGSSCAVNISTYQTRMPNGNNEIIRIINNMKEEHKKFIKNCGENTEARLNGENNTSNYNVFNWGINSNNTSIKIPIKTHLKKSGYFQDRRPSSNVDPYLIIELIYSSLYKEDKND